jgi:pyrroloquinoline quinone biosynthesis protein D
MPVELIDVPVHAQGVLSRLVDGETVLVHPAQGKVRVLNRVGTRLWELADGQRSVEEMAAIVADEYGVDIDRARVDALVFCADLEDRGVLSNTQ